MQTSKLELVSVLPHEGRGFAVRLADSRRLISVQEQEEDAFDIADLLTFKIAVDQNVKVSSVLLRAPNSAATFVEAEESLRALSWDEFLSKLEGIDQEAAKDEEAAASLGAPTGATSADPASDAPTFASSSQGPGGAAAGEMVQPQSVKPEEQEGLAGPGGAPAQQAAGPVAAALVAAAGPQGVAPPAPGPAGGSPGFLPPPRLMGCYRPPSGKPLLSVQVALTKVGGKSTNTQFGSKYTRPEAAGMARDCVIIWEQRRRGQPLENRNYNFYPSLYTQNAELMAELAAAGDDMDALKRAVMQRFMSEPGQAAAAAAVAAAGLVVPAAPPLVPPGDAAGSSAAPAATSGPLNPKHSRWKLHLDRQGAQKLLTGSFETALHIAEAACEAVFGSAAAVPPKLLVEHERQLEGKLVQTCWTVDVGAQSGKGFRLGRGWAAVASALQVQAGDTLVLRRGPSGGAAATDAPPAVAGAVGGCQLPRVRVSVVRGTPPAGAAGGQKGAAQGPASPASAVPGGAPATTPPASKKRTAEEAGLLRSPGGTIKQLCVDAMLAAARDKQQGQLGQAAQAQQQQQHADQEPPIDLEATQPLYDEELPVSPQQAQPQPLPTQQQQQQQRQAQQPAGAASSMPAPVPRPGKPAAGVASQPGAGGAGAAEAPAAAPAAAGVPAGGSGGGDAAAAGASSDPYALYCSMKRAVLACGLSASVRHDYFQAFMRMPGWQQRMHCDEVVEMAAENLHSQLRAFLESEAAGVAGQTVSAMSGGTAEGGQTG